MDYYGAWADLKPTFSTSGGLQFPGANPENIPVILVGSGGAAIGLHYWPAGTDPVGTTHWFQIAWSNVVNLADGVQLGGYTYFVDNGGNPQGVYYDWNDIVYSNQTDLIDIPARPFSPTTQWYAATFIAFGSEPLKTLFISNQAILWGFIDPIAPAPVPEPSTFALSLTGIACWFARGLHRRVRRRIMQACPSS